MGALLALIPLKDWLYGGAIVALIAFGVHERNHLIAEGQQHEIAALKTSSEQLQKQTAAQTATLQAKATMAEQAYEKEVLANSNQPPVQPVRLCVAAARSGGVMPDAGAKVAGNVVPGAVAGSVQPVSAGNPGSGSGIAGPDISQLLQALAARADQVSAALREFQSR
jgi:hypothetical protein